MMISAIAWCAGSVIFFLLISAYLPFIGPLFSLLIPLPFLYYTRKLGLSQGWRIGFISVFIVSLLARLIGSTHLILLCLELGIVGLIISELFERELTFGLTIFWGTVLMLFISAVFLLFIGFSQGMSPIELILDYFQSNLDNSITLYEGMDLDQEKMLQVKELGRVLNYIIAEIYPALLIIGAGVVIWINVVMSKPLFLLKGIKYPDLGRTDRWHAPEYMVWGVIAAGFSLFFPISGIRFVALNTLIVLLVIYFFHGLAIVMFFFNRYNIPIWVRLGVYFLLMVQQIFMLVLALGGLFDQWIDFRKIHNKGSASVES